MDGFLASTSTKVLERMSPRLRELPSGRGQVAGSRSLGPVVCFRTLYCHRSVKRCTRKQMTETREAHMCAHAHIYSVYVHSILRMKECACHENRLSPHLKDKNTYIGCLRSLFLSFIGEKKVKKKQASFPRLPPSRAGTITQNW